MRVFYPVFQVAELAAARRYTTLVQFAVDNIPYLQAQGIQDYHRIICDAVGIDQAWYQGMTPRQNSPPWTTPP